MADTHKHSYDAKWMYNNVIQQIQAFEDGLDEESEAAVRLASFGSSITMSVERIGYEEPHLFFFCGKVKGEDAQLIQHVDQLNFLLVAEKKSDPELPARRLGFECAWEIPEPEPALEPDPEPQTKPKPTSRQRKKTSVKQ